MKMLKDEIKFLEELAEVDFISFRFGLTMVEGLRARGLLTGI